MGRGGSLLAVGGGYAILRGGYPYGGTYSGIGVSIDTFDFDNVRRSLLDTIYYTYTDANGCKGVTFDTVLIFWDCVGIKNVVQNNQIQIYPNPADDYAMIDFDPGFTGATIILKDITGRELLQTKLGSTPQKLPTGNLPAGVYVITLHTDTQIGVRLLIKN